MIFLNLIHLIFKHDVQKQILFIVLKYHYMISAIMWNVSTLNKTVK